MSFVPGTPQRASRNASNNFAWSTPPRTAPFSSSRSSTNSASEARASRRARLAQRCVDRLKLNRSERLRRYRMQGTSRDQIRDQTLQVLREELSQFSAEENPFDEEELLLLEQDVLNEIYAEEERVMRSFEAEERARAQELEHYAEIAEHAEASSQVVVCPICMQNQLHLSGTVFHCNCGFRLDARNECFSLGQLQQRLATIMETHAMQNPPCTHQPRFFLKKHFGGIELLVMECSGCSCVQIIL
eukprot:CAMPEP_0171485410 /NCGR_PEP_ID=MMETSP0958-20121227/529_1 /TAXON_ID=87120 /ORGANISM="Aurantiochytrium limacinum, Strain ATCCMYA-1381" /LENGTH=244 /DNA_ID=CAMNT_0012018195 /DNA_START=60 /DNA_END=794 /DNA_ORIENTATION=-